MVAPATSLTSRLVAATAAMSLASPLAAAVTVEDLRSLSIEELASIDVSSVSKTAEPLNGAAAAIYVITSEAIARSGAQSVPEILRLAPNLFVGRTGAGRYVITARGFSGNPDFQGFANKLLVLIDGRSVYTPLYSGVYWEMQDVLPADIERIEVISGPGATLWGANAVNGVINIITRGAAATQGGLATATVGDFERSAALRWGGKMGDDVAYRVYARAFRADQIGNKSGVEADDAFDRVQGGFRLDWTPTTTDTVTVQGDIYDGGLGEPGRPDETIAGHNLLARLTRSYGGASSLQLQAYYDRVERGPSQNGLSLSVDTYDLSLQRVVSAGRHSIVAGAGIRFHDYQIQTKPDFFFFPSTRTLKLANAFVQDTIQIAAPLRLTLGLKVEDNPYSGTALLPNMVLAFAPGPRTLVWAGVSRAIRSPTPFDRDVVQKLGGATFLTGSADFRPETLIAYEAGTRVQVGSRLALSFQAFYNDYDDLRSIELTPTTIVPLFWGNLLKARSYGFDAWADYALADWWRLSAGLSYLEVEGRFAPESSRLGGTGQAGDDPRYRASLKSAINLGTDVTFDTALRYVSALPDPRIPAYVEADARVAWNMTPQLRLAVSGNNLLHKRHREYPAPGDPAVPRSVAAEVQWRF